MNEIRRITVLGAGTMGHGIAHAAVSSGYDTTLYDVSETQLSKARGQIESVFKKAVELGKATAQDADAGMARLRVTASIADALAGADFVIEAAP